MEERLTIEEFQSLLERELIQFTICAMIFEGEHKLKYVPKIIAHKRKIEDISHKLGCSTILTDDTIFDMFANEVLVPLGHPKFYYRNPEASRKFDLSIRFTVFKIGSKVRVYIDKAFQECTVVRNLVHSKELIVDYNGTKSKVSYMDIENPIKKQDVKRFIKLSKWKKLK